MKLVILVTESKSVFVPHSRHQSEPERNNLSHFVMFILWDIPGGLENIWTIV